MDGRTPNPNTLWESTDNRKKQESYSLARERAKQPFAESAAGAADNAKFAAMATLPCITMTGIAMMKDHGGYISLAPLGLPVAVGGIIIDTAKAPVCLAIATEEAVRAGVTKVASLLFEKNPVKAETKRIYDSFLKRMQETAFLLVALGLEDKDVLNKKLKSGNIEDLVGLTLLYTAYASRHYGSGLILENDKRLDREECPRQGLTLFDKIVNLKNSINKALDMANGELWLMRDKDERNKEESRIVCQWIREIYIGNPLTAADHPGATKEQINLVNDIIAQIQELKRSGMNALPESPADITRHMPGPGF